MRKVGAWVLLFVGAFLLVAGLVAQVWAEPRVKKTPEEVDTTTYLAGTAEKLNPETGEVEDLDVKVRSVTETDTDASDDDTVIFVTSTCVVIDEPETPDCVDGDDPRLVTASTDVFASDRQTALAVDDDDLPEDAVPHEGLVNKFPFDTEKKDYPYWDGLLEEARTAEYVGTDTLNGLETYVFEVVIEDEPAVVTGDIEGLYSAEKTIWVDPTTGSIVNQEQRDVRTLENGDPLIDLSVAFTEDQVETSVDEAEDNRSSLRLITVIVPLVGIIGGLVLLVAGIALLALDRRRQTEQSHAPQHRVPAGR